MYLARKHTEMSFPEIGRFMGNKNHSTVILACRRISKMLQGDEAARWMTPAGQKEQPLAILIDELEKQCCCPDTGAAAPAASAAAPTASPVVSSAVSVAASPAPSPVAYAPT